ncbi:Ribosome biogenesis protein ERB1 [Giardia muris]|uniref:Ribosome biogenesis protein ERB1 n=1 Tax=Giardia muris TaxID=5742 RepID=A0A4Z1SLZ1_GIAMU|nr:Ribosome biogenesis protein ERB1 [Giardia muris]|eukprot:TNJ26684.1 Ribosome biogenesis protein ERB1 [Giardia muris]
MKMTDDDKDSSDSFGEPPESSDFTTDNDISSPLDASTPSEFERSGDELSSSSDNGGHGDPLDELNPLFQMDKDAVYNIWGQIVGSRSKDIAPDGTSLDTFLQRNQNPEDFYKTVYDPDKGYVRVDLSPSELELVRAVMLSKSYDKSVARQNVQTCLINKNKPRTALTKDVVGPKRNYTPRSYLEAVERMREKMERGEYVYEPDKYKVDENRELGISTKDLWDEASTLPPHSGVGRAEPYVNPLRPPVPGHAASYNPPLDYLDGDKEIVPVSLRRLKRYEGLAQEQYERCVLLYTNPRERPKPREDIESLLPILPNRELLKPFPSMCAYLIRTGTRSIEGLTFSPSGLFFAAGGRDGVLRVFETMSGRQLRAIPVLSLKRLQEKSKAFTEYAINDCKWAPRFDISLIAVCAGDELIFVDPGVTERGMYGQVREQTRSFFNARPEEVDPAPHMYWELQGGIAAGGHSYTRGYVHEHAGPIGEGSEDDDAEKERFLKEKYQRGHDGGIDPDVYSNYYRLTRYVLARVKHTNLVTLCNWHPKGDYIISLSTGEHSRAELTVHQISKRRSFNPLKKQKGKIVSAHFLPDSASLVILSERSISNYNLQDFSREKKLYPSVGSIMASTVGRGDNLVVGGSSAACAYFPGLMGQQPASRLHYHTAPIRSLDLHPCGGLLATCSDDGVVHISRIVDPPLAQRDRVFDSLREKMLPCVVLAKEQREGDHAGIHRVVWHPSQPWLLSAGTDGQIRLWR